MPRLTYEEREAITASLYGAMEYLYRAKEIASQKGVKGLMWKLDVLFQKVGNLYRILTGQDK